MVNLTKLKLPEGRRSSSESVRKICTGKTYSDVPRAAGGLAGRQGLRKGQKAVGEGGCQEVREILLDLNRMNIDPAGHRGRCLMPGPRARSQLPKPQHREGPWMPAERALRDSVDFKDS